MIARAVKEAIMAKKLEYSRFKADFQEKDSSGGRQFLNRGIMAGVAAAQFKKAVSEFFPQKLFFGKDDPFIEQGEG